MDPEHPRFDRLIVFDPDEAEAKKRLAETRRTATESGAPLIEVQSWVHTTRREECLAEVSAPGRSLLIADVYARDVRAGPRGARLMKAVAQHPDHGPRTHRVLVYRGAQTIPAWAASVAHAFVPSDSRDASVFESGLRQAFGTETTNLPEDRVGDITVELRRHGHLRLQAQDVPTAIAIYERAVGVSVGGGSAAETRSERDLLGWLMSSGIACDPRDARERLTQAMSLSSYSGVGFPADRIAPEVVYTAQRAAALRTTRELSSSATWLTEPEHRLALTFLQALHTVQRRHHGDVPARAAVDESLTAADYCRTRDELGFDDSDTVYAIWTLVDACSSKAAQELNSDRAHGTSGAGQWRRLQALVGRLRRLHAASTAPSRASAA